MVVGERRSVEEYGGGCGHGAGKMEEQTHKHTFEGLDFEIR